MSTTDKNNDLISRVSELEAEIKRLKSRKKFGLVWENKPEKFEKESQNALPVLKEKGGKFDDVISDKQEDFNILVEGDNYHALSVLSYTHKDKVDIIYIDPPYNTGSKSWKYNNHYVDKDDDFKHSKWVSFIEKRLRLGKELLSDKGIIVVTIDDYEIGTIRLLMDEIFGENNRLGLVTIMHNPRGRSDDKYFATSHEYALFYSKNEEFAITYKIDLTLEQRELFNLSDQVSNYRLLPLKRTGSNSTPKERPKLFFPIFVNKSTLEISLDKKSNDEWFEVWPKDGSGSDRVWRWGKEKIEESWKTDIVVKVKNNKCSIFTKDRIKNGRKPKTIWVDSQYDASSHGTVLLEDILGRRKVFDYPKSLYAVIDTLKILSKERRDVTVLDFFAGSGTTGHAVLELNKQDGGKRKFILCTNNENGICEDVTYERMKRVIKGYKNSRGEKIEGLGGNLKYLKTDFVGLDKVNDNLKKKMVDRSTEVLCLKENTFNLVADKYAKTRTKIFENSGKYTAILFDLFYFDDFIEEISKLKDKPVSVYVFSYTKDFSREEFGDLGIDFTVEAIPEKILETYKKIFNF